MKDSGIAWIGEIPKHWNTIKLGDLYSQRKEKVSDKDFPPLSVTMQGILPQLETAAKTDDGDNRKLVRIGDFAINSRSDRRGSCGISAYDGSVSLINTVLVPRNEMNPIYYNWLFHTSLFADEYYKWGHGIVDDLWTTKWQEMKNISVVAPDLEEQSRIANFLDKKCAEIDELIALQEQMIAQLNTYKQAVITETVTKGLNPNVKMKDSGVEWIGEIPEHWDVCKIQYMANLKSGYNLTTEQITDEGLYPVYGGNGIRGFYHEFFNDGEYVLIGRQGALCGNINYSTGKFWATEHAVICYPKMQYATKWFGELLRSMNLNQYSLASAQPGLAVERIKALSIPLPPASEQQSIANYLDQKCKEIDELISIKKEKIEHLKAYKKSVIYEYVTGKKQVFDN
ncbi:MAG: restriction endonuclease subunit S [Bacteroides sp]|nr:restriction endonuclease subunit S [Bacteroides sp.]